MISSMGTARKSGLMVLGTLGTISTGKKMERASCSSVMDLIIREVSTRTIYMVKVNTFGLIKRPMMVIGFIIKCREKEKYGGRINDFMTGNTKMIKNMDMVNLSGKMEEFTKANGRTGNSMVKEPIRITKELKKKENG